MLVLLSAIGRIALRRPDPLGRGCRRVLVTLAVGAASFCCLGLRPDRGASRRESAAPPITNIASSRSTSSPASSSRRARSPTACSTSPTLFPVRHFFEAFFTAWDPATAGAGFEWGDLAVVAAWGVAGFVIALRSFAGRPAPGSVEPRRM